MMLIPFPVPPAGLRAELGYLNDAKEDDNQRLSLCDPADHPRPWDPSTCNDNALRLAVWQWCEQFVEWVNHEHAWLPKQMIPGCWPAHPHLAREIPVLALLRWDAEMSLTVKASEEWLRQTYPTFCTRMAERLGDGGCRTGNEHTDWPARGRHTAASSTKAAGARERGYQADHQGIGGDAASAPLPRGA